MGAAVSKEEEVYLDAVSGASEEERTPGGSKAASVTKLYKLNKAVNAGRSAPGTSTWELVEKDVKWKFVQAATDEDEDDSDRDEEEDEGSFELWYLSIPGYPKVSVEDTWAFKFNDDNRRVNFFTLGSGPLALKFASVSEYESFKKQYQKCKFENTHGKEYTEANVNKVIGKDFVKGWVEGEDSDEVMLDAEESFAEEKMKRESTAAEDYKEVLKEQNSPLALALGARDNSFLLHSSGIDVFKNDRSRICGKGTTIKLNNAGAGLTPVKGVLIQAETGMLLMSPAQSGTPHSSGVRQLDLEKETVVAEWKFAKDGTAINMRDVTNDSKGAQLEPTRSTFLGLDDNRLCRWDMREKYGVVQELAAAGKSPVLTWDEGHQFSCGTNFTCLKATGDGCIAVGSKDGKIRLYSTTTMRQAKTAFPAVGSPITCIDVTFDGHWVLGTCNKFLVLLNTMWRDDKGSVQSAFTTRAGSKGAAPRFLMLHYEHVGIVGPGYKFDKACFSWVTEAGKTERHIVATVSGEAGASYSLIWDLRKVQKDHDCYRQSSGAKTCTCYKVRELDESVVDLKFMNMDDSFKSLSMTDAPLVVATPHKISSLQFQE